jgi:hypothetical protein
VVTWFAVDRRCLPKLAEVSRSRGTGRREWGRRSAGLSATPDKHQASRCFWPGLRAEICFKPCPRELLSGSFVIEDFGSRLDNPLLGRLHHTATPHHRLAIRNPARKNPLFGGWRSVHGPISPHFSGTSIKQLGLVHTGHGRSAGLPSNVATLLLLNPSTKPTMRKKNRKHSSDPVATDVGHEGSTTSGKVEELVSISIAVDLGDGVPPATIVESIRPEQTVREVIAAVFKRLGRKCVPSEWILVYRDKELPANSQLAWCLPLNDTSLELILKPRAGDTTALAPSPSYSDNDGDESFYGQALDYDIATSETLAFPTAKAHAGDRSAGPISSLGTRSLAEQLRGRRSGQSDPNLKRHATVRYFRRMNPDVLYPLMVLITSKAIEDVKADRLGQRSVAGLTINTDDPVEIEPLLPGCDCVPPRLVARLEAGDLSAVFRILPRAVGRLEGATVMIRQNHTVIAEIPLEMRVSRKLWAILLGVATFVLPAISALLKHFGLDFETQAGQGFDLYLAVARVVFDQLSPSVLTAVLGLCTGLVWWSCRPRAEDVFWDLGVAGPETRLRRVREELRKGSDGAVGELKAIVDAFPNHWPARLLLAEWHYHTEDYRQSLDEYKLALGHEAGAPEDYLRASLSASHLGDKQEALRLIQDAETRLGEAKLLPTMLFNAGCYSSLIGEPDKAMLYLRKAVAAGADDIAAYSRDPDLDSLRHRQDFQELLDGDLAVHFACPHCDCPCSAPVSTVGTRRQCMKCKGVVSIPPWE